MPKAVILFYDTDYIARILKREIKDGTVEIDNKLYYVDESKSLLLKTKLGYLPLYLIKWNKIKPSTNVHEPPKIVSPEFNDKISTEMTPEMFRKLVGLKILGNMIKTKAKAEFSNLLLLLMGVVIGAVIFWSLQYLKVI